MGFRKYSIILTGVLFMGVVIYLWSVPTRDPRRLVPIESGVSQPHANLIAQETQLPPALIRATDPITKPTEVPVALRFILSSDTTIDVSAQMIELTNLISKPSDRPLES